MKTMFQTSDNSQIEINVGALIGAFVIIVLVVGAAVSCVYSIGPDETGVVLRFGEKVRIVTPGLHFKLPFGIEQATKVRTKHVFKEEFGFRTVQAGVRTEYSKGSYDAESVMLTGDLNSAVVEWIVQYRVKDPFAYLFKLKDPEGTLRNASQAIVRLIVGDRTINEVLTIGRIEIGTEVKKGLQELMDQYQSGIEIVNVNLQDVNPPGPVQPSFNDVNAAKQEKEKLINQAWEQYNKEIPRAKGQALRVIQEAEGYAMNRVNRSQGDAKRFLSIYEEYKSARDITRRRMYLETMLEVLPQIERKYLIDPEEQGILKFLPLTEDKRVGS